MYIKCTICTVDIGMNGVEFITQCGHIFHYDCLKTWLQRTESCPQCREKVTLGTIIRMFPSVTSERSNSNQKAKIKALKNENDALKRDVEQAGYWIKSYKHMYDSKCEEANVTNRRVCRMGAEIEDLKTKLAQMTASLKEAKQASMAPRLAASGTHQHKLPVPEIPSCLKLKKPNKPIADVAGTSAGQASSSTLPDQESANPPAKKPRLFSLSLKKRAKD